MRFSIFSDGKLVGHFTRTESMLEVVSKLTKPYNVEITFYVDGIVGGIIDCYTNFNSRHSDIIIDWLRKQ